eukprot:7952056-Alexandrium_andersonii.AAC.1
MCIRDRRNAPLCGAGRMLAAVAMGSVRCSGLRQPTPDFRRHVSLIASTCSLAPVEPCKPGAHARNGWASDTQTGAS